MRQVKICQKCTDRPEFITRRDREISHACPGDESLITVQCAFERPRCRCSDRDDAMVLVFCRIQDLGCLSAYLISFGKHGVTREVIDANRFECSVADMQCD